MSDQAKDNLVPQLQQELLKNVGLFRDLGQETIHLLSQELPCIKVELGDKVIEEGDASQIMYIVLSGELEVMKRRRDGSQVTVALLGPGDWFGEMSLLESHPRSATVRALAPSMLLAMSADHVHTMLAQRDLQAYATLLLNIARELSRRLRVADGLVAQVVSSAREVYGPPSRKRQPG